MKPKVLPWHWHWRFSSQIWLFLGATFSFGLAQAVAALFLNFYLRALGLGAEWQGAINALPAVTLALAGLPAAALARRISNARTLQLGSALMLVGTGLLAAAPGAGLAIAGTLFQGVGSACVVVAGAPFMAGKTGEQGRVTLFSLQAALMTGAGFLGNLLGGRVPAWYAGLYGGGARDLDAIRAALVVTALVQLLGLLPVAFLRPDRGPRPQGHTLAVQDRAGLIRLILPNILVGLGAGATIPFLNVFIEGKFGVSYASLGALFAWTSLATALTALVQPWLVGRLGQLRTVLLVQAGSLPFLALLGYGPELWMVTLALFTRGALMNAAGPVYGAYAMSRLSEPDRPMYSALNTMGWDLGWAISSVGSGLVRAQLPAGPAFNLLFGITLTFYGASVLAIYIGLCRERPRSARYTEG